jgi:hypothetical protein
VLFLGFAAKNGIDAVSLLPTGNAIVDVFRDTMNGLVAVACFAIASQILLVGVAVRTYWTGEDCLLGTQTRVKWPQLVVSSYSTLCSLVIVDH